jgi:hypothetical protein
MRGWTGVMAATETPQMSWCNSLGTSCRRGELPPLGPLQACGLDVGNCKDVGSLLQVTISFLNPVIHLCILLMCLHDHDVYLH